MSFILRNFFAPLAVLLVSVSFVSGCGTSEDSSGSGGGAESGDATDLATMAAPAEGEPVSALSGIEAADEAATGWQGDAELYAIAAATPRLDAEGGSPSWLYTYVSETAGAVRSVTYTESESARLDPAQELPESDITYIAENTLPEVARLTDSPEAISRTEEVSAALGEDPGIAASAGLDSFSGNGPEWIFATTRGDERVEERVPAVGGS